MSIRARLVSAGRRGCGADHARKTFSAGALARLLELAAVDVEPVVIDLSALNFIDHHGVMALGRFGNQLSGQGKTLEIQHAPYQVARICELIGVEL